MQDRRTKILEVTDPAYPLPPLNVSVLSPYEKGKFDIRWDSPSILAANSKFHIVGVNIYRSFDSEFGPYERINKFPVQATFWRDATDIVSEIDEDVSGRFVLRGNSPVSAPGQLPQYVIQVRHTPIVKAESQGIFADNPDDVVLTIDGQRVGVDRVVGASGEVYLKSTVQVEVATQKLVQPVLPGVGSVVLCSYRWARSILRTDLANRVFYRVTTVAVVDQQFVETPVTSELVSTENPAEVEKRDYIWEEAIRRVRWILNQGGERAKVFIRKENGLPCSCVDQLGRQTPKGDCAVCFGTGFRGGYEGPYEIIIAPDDAEKRHRREPRGSNVEHVRDVFFGPSPLVSQRDFILTQSNQRYAIGPVKTPSARGMILQQHFSMGLLDEKDIRYRVPVYGLSQLVYPQTRAPSAGGGEPDHTVLVDPQVTDKSEIPAERQQRGRTATWGNIEY
jgi:hypothetical protein